LENQTLKPYYNPLLIIVLALNYLVAGFILLLGIGMLVNGVIMIVAPENGDAPSGALFALLGVLVLVFGSYFALLNWGVQELDNNARFSMRRTIFGAFFLGALGVGGLSFSEVTFAFPTGAAQYFGIAPDVNTIGWIVALPTLILVIFTAFLTAPIINFIWPIFNYIPLIIILVIFEHRILFHDKATVQLFTSDPPIEKQWLSQGKAILTLHRKWIILFYLAVLGLMWIIGLMWWGDWPWFDGFAT
jgi:hypothetical protein